VIPWAILTKFGMGKGVLGPLSRAKLHSNQFRNVDLLPPQIVKIGNFWYKFAHKGKSWECTEKKSNTDAQLETFLCKGIITILKKITLLNNNVSIYTNSFTLSFQAQNLHFQQNLTTINDYWYLLDCLHRSLDWTALVMHNGLLSAIL